MKVHIAIAFGGRHYQLTQQDIEWLDGMQERFGFRLLLHGGATGADAGAAAWARSKGMCDAACPAQWEEFRRKYGSPNGAGPARNERMASACGNLNTGLVAIGLAFPGNTGTRNMHKNCDAQGIPVYASPGYKP